MRADTTRDSHQPARHYRSVLQQQGRVALDAEWNEQRSIDDRLRHTALADVLGESAGPIDGAAFALSASGATLTVGAGRYYLNGVLVENDAAVPLGAQPHLPAGVPAVLDAAGAALSPPTAGTYVAELGVWTRLVTALDDPALREVAVPVPDTTTRAQTVWQVRLVRVAGLSSGLTCDDLPVWSALRAPTTGRLRARTQPGSDSSTPCEVPADAGYRGPDNQHYRVEVRDAGTQSTATFVWSRENASVQARWLGQSGNRLTVAVPTGDPVLGFAADDWVELVDDATEAAGRPGTMVQVDTVHDDVVVVRPATATPSGASVDLTTMGSNPRIRRWEGPPRSVGGGWLALERGVEVDFDSGTYRSGEYWSLPARPALHDLLWPRTGSTPDWLRPAGPDRRYAPLALLEFDGTAWTVTSDCRSLFPPLTSLVTLRYVGGDGQAATPDPADPTVVVPLAEPLRVAVANGNRPVAGRGVELSVTVGGGTLDAGSGPAASVVALTDADGVATVTWAVDSGTDPQQVTARLRTPSGDPVDVPVVFSASLLRATDVAVDPSTCPALAGAGTVQEALEALCAASGDGCVTIVVSPGERWSEPLRAIPAGSSVSICVQPGTYELADPVVLADLLDVTIDGAGLGSHVNGEKLETLLRFERCERVVVRGLRLTARASIWPGAADVGRGGVVTAIGCGSVTVETTTLACGAGTRRGSACLTVLGRPGGTDVAVRDCHLLVGHLQQGVLVVDGRQVRVLDSVVGVSRKPESLSFEALLRDPQRRRLLIGRLVASPQLAGGPAQPGTGIRLGPWLTRFDSAIAPAEWAERTRANPPTAADLGSADAVRAYVGRLADAAMDDPATFPAFQTRLGELQTSVGTVAFRRLLKGVAGRASVRALLLGSVIDVQPATDRAVRVTGRGGTVDLRLGTARVAFASPVPQKTWEQALRLADVREVADDRALLNALYRVARRVLVDGDFRARLGAFAAWYAGLLDRNPAAAASGVVCGGRLAADVLVSGCAIGGVVEGVRVALSHAAASTDAPDMAGTVRIEGCSVRQVLPIDVEAAPHAVFVGNAERVSVAQVSTSVDGVRRGGVGSDAGVVVHGHLGPRLAVHDNVLDHASTGVRVVALSGDGRPHLWYVRDNVAPSAVAAVDAPSSVAVSGNVGA